MMKENKTILQLILFTFIYADTSLLAQPYNLQKTWVGADLEYLKLDSQKVHFEVFGSYPENINYLIKKDTLRLFSNYTSSGDGFSKVHTRNYDFLIKQKTPQTLKLLPVNALALELSNDKKLLKYTERSLIKDTNFNFLAIRFKATTCYGTCPDMTVEITNKKELKFIGGEYAIKKGLFNAKVSDSLYSELLELLSLSDLKNLKTWPQVLRDAPEYTLEIAYDNQIKCLKTFLLPSVCGDLIHYLYAVPGKVVLQKQEEPIELHFQGDCGKYPNPIYTD